MSSFQSIYPFSSTNLINWEDKGDDTFFWDGISAIKQSQLINQAEHLEHLFQEFYKKAGRMQATVSS